MRILITGSRELTDRNLVYSALAEAVYEFNQNRDTSLLVTGTAGDVFNYVTVVHGAAHGADTLAGQWANILEGFTEEKHPADWDRHGKAAGFIRNQDMVDLGADVCLAFFKEGAGNKGTQDCMRRADEAGIPVKRFYEKTLTEQLNDAMPRPEGL